MTIKIDITGFYYETEIDPTGIVTVEDAMREAANQPAPNGGILSVSSDLNGFVNKITVRYPSTARPVSRQDGSPRPVGTYSFDDNPLDGSNVIPCAGSIDGQLAWQYYVRRAGVVVNSDREIIPFNQSDSGSVGPLQDNDVIIWRLVGIFGLRNMMKERAEELQELVADGENLSMKSALRALRS